MGSYSSGGPKKEVNFYMLLYCMLGIDLKKCQMLLFIIL